MTTETLTLSQFLLERIAEDEHRGAIYDGEFTPHVLATCKAHRAIVETVAGWKHEVVEDCWYTCPAATEEQDGGETCNDAVRGTGCNCGRDYRANAILRALASIYADHPSFDPRWAL